MTIQTSDTLSFVRHLRTAAEPFRARRRPARAGPAVGPRPAHDAAYGRDPELYALCALADRARPEQRARVLFQLLERSRAGLGAAPRQTLDRVSSRLAAALPADDVMAVFLALRRARANHKHVRRAVVRYLLNHPRLTGLARRRRPAVVDCLEHALGRDVARGCAKVLAAPGAGPAELAYLRRNLLRFADSPDAAARAGAVVRFLYGHGDLLPAEGDAAGARDVDPLAPLDRAPAERPRTATATNRGDVSATLVHLYRGGDSPDLRAALDRYVAEAVAGLPRFDGSVALVLDASASTRGYGEREFACLAQSQALRLVLARCCAVLRIVTIGGGGTPGEPGADPPRPDGNTDLAGAVLDALEAGPKGPPDVVAIVSDGYENVAEGDLARVLASLPAAGVRTPVVFCHSMFTAKDDLSLRRPTAAVPGVAEVEFWHQDDFADVLWTVFASAGDGKGEAFVRAALRRRLEANAE